MPRVAVVSGDPPISRPESASGVRERIRGLGLMFKLGFAPERRGGAFPKPKGRGQSVAQEQLETAREDRQVLLPGFSHARPAVSSTRWWVLLPFDYKALMR